MRADLHALTPEALAALANPGLVKRAQRELGAGQGPTVEEAADGTVTGTFPDGAKASLPPGTSLREAPCSCGAVTVCRHRVALALAYAAKAPVAEAPVTSASPGAIDDAALEAGLGKRTLERARRQAPGTVVHVQRGEGGEPPRAGLPSCTVRFLVPTDPTWARCDCAAAGRCEHVALAVWAFRQADATRADARELTLELGGVASAAPSTGEAPAAAPRALPPDALAGLEQADGLVRDVLVAGVALAPPVLARRFAEVGRALDDAGLAWPADAARDLEDQLRAYQERSARHRPARVAALLAELAARGRAARAAASELPPRFVLGLGEARETALDQARLVSIGARVEADGDDREASVLLVDAATADVLVVTRRWSFEPGQALDGPALAGRTVAPNVPLGTLAHGQLVTRAGKRAPDRRLTLGPARGGVKTAVGPQTGAWGELPAPVLVGDLADHEARLRTRPPRCLRPRLRSEDVHVVAVAEHGPPTWAPGEQTLWIPARAAGGELRLALHHQPAAPRAVDALAAAVAAAPVRFASGVLRPGPSGLVLDLLAVVTDRVVVPDLEPAAGQAHELHDPAAARDPLGAALAEARGALEALAHHGLRRPAPGAAARALAAAARLDACGAARLAGRVKALGDALRAHDTHRREEDAPGLVAPWVEAALALEVAAELATVA